MASGQGRYGSNNYFDDPGYREYGGGFSGGSASVSGTIEQIKSNIFKINSGANSIDKAMKSIGTDRDSVQLRDKIHETSQNISKLVQDSMRQLKVVGNKPADKQQKIQLSKLRNDFQESVERFQGLQKMATEKVKSSVKLGSRKATPQVDSGMTGWNDPDDFSDKTQFYHQEERRAELQEQQQVVEDDLALIREREERIRQLESDILDVNEIFRDLGALVSEQGETLDTIEANVERTYGNVEQANSQLSQAAVYQKKARKKKCCLLVILLVVAIVITIIIVVSVKS
ncbi:hypothetical protein LOTGIDRAFT_237001 [Lottia gigantea]|uniref:t-SNARE coiled-coil homology domain-containing protein n=1 Tax=Lottia gigantea TaxID=225164 RepID=V3YWJ2_LOTGI|nr:hypothetical protein LOTGIDRAFT_237001 [Lottia gigantea]ESO82383.1 hypothetical protein LOTGIDRAFT_237001 [Lottia gigantea]